MTVFNVLTLFPETVKGALGHSIIKRAAENSIIKINTINIRDFSKDKHKRVDDYPYGGGAGMLIAPQPVYDAYKSIEEPRGRVIYMTPQGKKFCQETAEELSREKNITILCGHYEGIDERVLEEIVTDEISVGDYVLTGGELAACIVIDAVSRLIDGVLNKSESFENETFSDGLCEYPQYTRPEEFLGKKVPDVLLSGNHGLVENWRREISVKNTLIKRPDMADTAYLTKKEREYVKAYREEKLKEICGKLVRTQKISDTEILFLLKYRKNVPSFGNFASETKTITFSDKSQEKCLLTLKEKNAKNSKGFRLNESEIISEALHYGQNGIKRVILSCGKDAYFTDDVLSFIIEEIKNKSDISVISDFGIKDENSLKIYQKSGSDMYCCRIHTASKKLFSKIYPILQLNDFLYFYDILKRLNFPTIFGFTSSLPYETEADILESLRFIKENKPTEAFFEPFTPKENTEFSDMQKGDPKIAEFLNGIASRY